MTNDPAGAFMEDDPELRRGHLFSWASGAGGFLRGDPLYFWWGGHSECGQFLAGVPLFSQRAGHGDSGAEQFRPAQRGAGKRNA